MKPAIFISIVFFASIVFCRAQVLQKNKDSAVKSHNKIDDIKNASEIEKLLSTIDQKRFELFTVNESLKFEKRYCEEFADTAKAEPWTKVDFDNNGYTDLLVIGKIYDHSVIVILDLSENNFVVKSLTQESFRDCTFPVVQKTGEQPTITYYTNIAYYSVGLLPPAATLIYKFGGFIELNESPKTYKIEKIEYRASGCFGPCPSFELFINSNRSALFKPVYFNKRKKGTYRGKIETSQFNELIDLLNYLDFPMLKNDYYVTWTDDQKSFLTITYDGGKVKKIEDYGLIGTFGLKRVYEILFDLRENQVWR